MRPRAAVLFCSMLMLQVSGADVARTCASESHASHESRAAATGHTEHEDHGTSHAVPDNDASGVPEDDCGAPASGACCIPALSCSMNLVSSTGPAVSATPTARDGRLTGSFDAPTLDPATPETPPPRA